MKLTIIKSDGAVYKDGVVYMNLNLPSIPSDVRALQFDDAVEQGHIEFDTPYGEVPAANEDITLLPDWATDCLTAWDEADYAHKNPPAPTPEELLAKCKSDATGYLSATDWVEIPSVSDATVTPHLLNKAELIAYRNAVRSYAVNPVLDPVFPAQPGAVWSS